VPLAWIPDLLDRLERQPTPQLWHDLSSLLVVEGEVFCRAGLAALPRLAALAERGGAESRDEALALASSIVRTLHKYHDADDLAEPAAFATLYRVAAGALPGTDFHDHFQAALSFAGYTFWAVIGLDYTDEHYHPAARTARGDWSSSSATTVTTARSGTGTTATSSASPFAPPTRRP
jgi:hypothetical protein